MNERHAKFVDRYLVLGVAKQAYIEAGYKARGISAEVSASRLLRHVKVAAAIAKARAERAERTKINADMVLRRLAALGLADPRDVVEWDEGDVTLRDSSELTVEQAATVAEVRRVVTPDGETTTVKLRDPMPSLALLAKHTGVVKDGATINVGGDHREVHVHFDGGPSA